MSSVDEAVDALYGLPLERFVAERDALAKTLRADGDRSAAEAVKRLPKPTRAAWAVNSAVREHPDRAEALADSARLLGDAQRELLGGGDASALREASDRASAAVDALSELAPASSAATLDAVRSTLHAATVDTDVLAAVLAGRLEHERVASGFGPVAAPEDGPRAPRRPRRDDAAARKAAARRQEKLRRAKEAEAAAENDLGAARRALEQVQAALAERREQVREAETRVRDARRRRERAERAPDGTGDE